MACEKCYKARKCTWAKISYCNYTSQIYLWELYYVKKHCIYFTHKSDQKTLSKIMMFQTKRTGEVAIRDSEKVQSK